jgi:ComF family protein
MGKAEAIRSALSNGAKPLRETLTLAGDALLAATLAPCCASCQRVLERPLNGAVCPVCWDDARRAHGHYDGALRNIIHAFKYEGRRSLAAPLGMMLRETSAPALRDAACVVPVPLFVIRRLRRGFNQAEDLSRSLDLPVVRALWRIRPTTSQTGLTAAERRRNVRGAFKLSPWLRRDARRRWIEGRIVVLVDDVMTTGATLNACAAVLTEAGAREVRTITVARA